MDYEKAYEDALERARELKNKLEKNCSLATSTGIESIFPELAESEDERIRKEILDYIDKATGCKRWISWLEKQGEQKSAWSEEDEQHCRYIINFYLQEYYGATSETIEWLENLKNRVQPQWRPTNKQMENLEYAINMVDKCCEDSLQSLYNDLKKL